MRIVLCDDDEKNLTATQKLLEEICEERGIDLEVFPFTSPAACIEFMLRHKADLVILAILMAEMLGTEAAKKLRMIHGNDFSLVFLSKSNDYAFESYAVDADYYILKPACKGKLLQAMERCDLFAKEDIVYIEEGKNTLKFNMQHIIAVEAFNKECRIYTAYEEYDVHTAFTKIKNILPEKIFWAVHRSYLVNVKHILKQEHNDFIMQNGLVVPISQTRVSLMKRRYAEWCLKNK